MDGLKRAANLRDVAGGSFDREWVAGNDDIVERSPWNIVHDHIRQAVFYEEVADAHDVGMATQREPSGFVLKLALEVAEIGRLPVVFVERFDHDDLVKIGLVRSKGKSEAAFAEYGF